jgi:nucleoside-diphosphate-sugar epimerase
MKRQNPRKILVTGASGFVGRNILEDLYQEYYIYVLARRTQQEAGVKTHKNIKWILVDIEIKAKIFSIYSRPL